MTPEKITDLLGEGKLVPKHMCAHEETSRQWLEDLGVRVTGEIEKHHLYRVELPAGWTVKPDFEMLTWKWRVHDENGNERFFMEWYPHNQKESRVFIWHRFYVNGSRFTPEDHIRHYVVDTIDGVRKERFSTKPAYCPQEVLIKQGAQHIQFTEREREINHEQKAECVAWLDEDYPEWRNPGKYWDE
jgi:hypothetical protein